MKNIQSYADLHLHSIYSDGELSPKKLINNANKNRVKVISITDHNMLFNSDERMNLINFSKKYGIELIDGIEISTMHNGISVHLLGYSRKFNPTENFNYEINYMHSHYIARGKKILKKMADMGYPIEMNEVLQKGATYAHRNIIAQTAKEKFGGEYSEWLKITVPEDDFFISAVKAIKYLHESNAVAILAHPGSLIRRNDYKTTIKIVEDLFQAGLDGVEAFSPDNLSTEAKNLMDIIRKKYDCIVTGGTDYHNESGRNKIGQYGLSEKEYINFIARL